MVLIVCLLIVQLSAFAQLPTPSYGWNLGNTLEATCGEGCWGPPASQALINSVANAGFNTVRIPCAWDTHANQTTLQIDPTYMARVKQIVDWCLARNMHVVLNCHWDGGWLENNITDTVNPTINAKMNSYWTQIATTFASYDSRLLFAGANEPNCDTAAEWNTLRTYYNTFINAVRGTGGNNSSRWLVVQGPNTDIDLTDSLMNTLPSDPTPNRLMVEVHYYSPYQFTLMDADQSWGNMFYFWGNGYHSTSNPSRNANWGEEAYLESEFQKMFNKFTSQGIPVIIGEFGAYKRGNLTGVDYDLNYASTTYFNKYVVDAANSYGMYPMFWNTAGYIFDWTTGAITDQSTITGLTGGPALPPPPASTLPSPWVSSDIGAVAAAGSGNYSGGTFTVIGSGADIWNTADEFRYVYQPSSGTCEIRAQVTSVQNTDPWAKAGVMIRESTAAGARHAAVFITPGNGVMFQWRSATGGACSYVQVTGVTAPRYVRLQRAGGNSFKAYYSSNGTSWTQIGASQKITMANSSILGLAVTSHNDGTLCTSTLNNVTATP